ncbi:hypothetical protein DXG03_000448 [Asterophora parasitica]|uniref:Uncharacterized protein n=1 Tax=Asterophora parasitica TaxID=117018 RepID=A0A9P7GHF4_9AGAR|nr:hypothetical protein DXG03_000448 [Asterophora parasitica]
MSAADEQLLERLKQHKSSSGLTTFAEFSPFTSETLQQPPAEVDWLGERGWLDDTPSTSVIFNVGGAEQYSVCINPGHRN